MASYDHSDRSSEREDSASDAAADFSPIEPSPPENVPARRRWGLLLLTLATGLLFFGGSAVLVFRHPSEPRIHLTDSNGMKKLNVEIFPSCWLYRLTGWFCPGCGATRAYHYLLRGDVKTSLRYHPLVAPLLPVLLFLMIRFFYEVFTRRELEVKGYNVLSCCALALILIFWVLRNLPWGALDILHPPQ